MSTYEIGSIVFDKWKICRELGQGSYGTVYEIQREDFGGVYKAALKVITVPQSRSELQSVLDEGMTPPQAKQYFYSVVEDIGRECAIMSRLKGTGNIVSYEDHTVIRHSDGIGWDILIRMELLHPLLPYVYQHPMARRDIIRLGIDICKALELCQRYNIIHRDIKPENIFISDNGDYKLGDFGIARTIERTTSGLSKKGTYSYMAPEVYIGKKYGFSVDTYSLGLVLYRMLNKNRGPFLPQPPEAITYDNREQALARRVSGEPLPRPFYGEGRLGEIVLKACAFDPKDRYSSPQQLRQELEAISYEAQDAALIYPNGDELQIDPSRYASGKSSGAAGTAGKTNAVFSDRPQRTSGTNRTQGVFDASGGGSPAPVRKEKKRKPTGGLVWVLVLVAGAAIAAGSLLLLHTRQEKQAQLAAAQQAQVQEQQNQYEALMEQGTQLCETDPEQALGCFEQAQALYPEESAPYISYAYALYCAQDYERCISYIEDELGLGKAYDIEAQSQLSEILGAAYFECDDYAAAASFFRLSTAGGDITVNAQRDYAVSLGRLGDIDAADEILSQMYAAGASGDVTDYVQAEIDYAKKEYLDAESGFQAVLNQTQDIALQKRALRSLAEVYRDCAALVRTGSSPIGNPATKAVEVLANGIETYGLRYDSTIWEMLALAYFEAYHTDPSVPQSYLRKAGECFNRVLELGVTKSYLYSNLYTIYYELQEYDLAEQTLDAYAAQYPKDYEPYAFRAMLYITLENRKEQSARDYSAAVEAYETAGQLLRSDDDATYYQQLQSLIQQLQKEGWING
ncbi:MAG: protein kinase domain-containing protein [Oscillospiraceae bacterium]